MFKALHALNEQPCSNADMTAKGTEEAGMAFPAAQLEQAPAGMHPW